MPYVPSEQVGSTIRGRLGATNEKKKGKDLIDRLLIRPRGMYDMRRIDNNIKREREKKRLGITCLS